MDSEELRRRKIEHNCRVCGFDWGMTREKMDHVMCGCCGCHVAYEDFTPFGARRYRQEWMDKGALWYRKHEKPTNWGPEMLTEQMKNIPEDYR